MKKADHCIVTTMLALALVLAEGGIVLAGCDAGTRKNTNENAKLVGRQDKRIEINRIGGGGGSG